MQAHPVRLSIFNVIATAQGKSTGDAVSNAVYLGTTLAMLAVAWLIALSTTSLGLVMQVVGATSVTAGGFVIPAILYLSLYANTSWPVLKAAAWALIAYGAAIFLLYMYNALL